MLYLHTQAAFYGTAFRWSKLYGLKDGAESAFQSFCVEIEALKHID